jgi:hypothetical protein
MAAVAATRACVSERGPHAHQAGLSQEGDTHTKRRRGRYSARAASTPGPPRATQLRRNDRMAAVAATRACVSERGTPGWSLKRAGHTHQAGAPARASERERRTRLVRQVRLRLQKIPGSSVAAAAPWGPVTLSLRTTVHPPHARFAKRVGASVSETAVRPSPTAPGSAPPAEPPEDVAAGCGVAGEG